MEGLFNKKVMKKGFELKLYKKSVRGSNVFPSPAWFGEDGEILVVSGRYTRLEAFELFKMELYESWGELDTETTFHNHEITPLFLVESYVINCRYLNEFQDEPGTYRLDNKYSAHKKAIAVWVLYLDR